MARKKRKRFVFHLLLYLAILVLAGAGFFVTLYFMVIYRPSTYNPAPLSIQQQKQAESRMWKKSETYANRMGDFSSSDSFIIEFDETLLNHMLLHDDTRYYLRETLGSSNRLFQKPQIAFSPGVIKVMGQVHHESLTALLTILLRPRIDEQARLEIRLQGIKLGAAPIPKKLQDHLLKEVIESMTRRVRRRPDDEVAQTLRKFITPLRQLMETGACIWPASFQAAEAENRRGRLTNIEITEDSLIIRIKPHLVGHTTKNSS